MSKQTAMQQLKEKIQIVIGEMNGDLNLYESGYKQSLINIQNDIDLQMLGMEKEQIVNAWNGGDFSYFYSKETGRDFEDGEDYYNETYGGEK